MAEGRTAYFGNAQGALEFFEHCGYKCPTDYNPADFFVQTLAIVPGKEQESVERVEVNLFFHSNRSSKSSRERTRKR